MPWESSASRCMGCQPERPRTDCETSSAERKSCDMNGLYCSANADSWQSAGARFAAPLPCSRPAGLAQASHASAATSLMDFATRRVTSIMGSAIIVVSNASLWPKSLEDHLVGIALGGPALIRIAHGPGQQREAESLARDHGQCRGQVIDRICDELRTRVKGLCEQGERVLRRGERPFALAKEAAAFCHQAARHLRRDLAQARHLPRIERNHAH